MLNPDLRHAITRNQVLEYEKNGVICVRDQFNQDWVEKILDAALGHMTAPKGPLNVQDDKDDPGKFVTGTHMSRFNEKFMECAINTNQISHLGFQSRFHKIDQSSINFCCGT